jgi:hypothetical protein
MQLYKEGYDEGQKWIDQNPLKVSAILHGHDNLDKINHEQNVHIKPTKAMSTTSPVP